MKIMHFAGGGDIGGAKTHILSLGKELAENNQFRLISFRKGPFSEEAKAKGLGCGRGRECLEFISLVSMLL